MAHRLRALTWTRLLALAAGFSLAVAQPAAAETYFTTTNASWRVFKGYTEASSPDALWRQPEFNDSTWLTAPAPFYYSDTATEPPFYNGGVFTGTLLGDMINNYTCLFLRKTFIVTNAPGAGPVTIQIAADDGFVAWLNGVEVARTNVAAGPIPYNGTALASLTEPYPVHSFVLSGGLAWLREGTNVLAVQGINSVSNSHDFGFMAGLSVEQDLSPPLIIATDPPPGGLASSMTHICIRVLFSEPVTNVNPADLLLNGVASESLTGSSPPTDYLFCFLQPGTGTVTVSWAPSHGIRDLSGNAFVGTSWNFQILSNLTASAVISEFMADNAGSLLDEDGIGSDWIEIHNTGFASLNLNNWCLTDDPTELSKWRFPATNVTANGYLVVFASGKNRRVPGPPLHTSFKLNQSTGFLALVQSDGTTIASAFGPAYPPQRENISFGIAADGSTNFFPSPTPGGANGTGVAGFVADTSFNVHRGFFFAPTNVVVGSATPGATLVYTLNGTDPSPSNGTQVIPPNPLVAPTVNLLPQHHAAEGDGVQN